MPETSFDIIIIGSGPGGYVTAIRAAQLGYKTAIVEKSYLGGICLNWGCIPTTGARPRVLPGLEPDQKLIWTYFEAMIPEKMPKSLLVVGSGAIGIEFASFFHTMGSDVTVVEVLPQILPVEDAEIAGLARKRLEKQGLKIMSSTKVTKLEKKADSVVATIDDGKGKPVTTGFERLIPFVGNGKAIALGDDQGLVKVIFDKKTGQLLGAHMVGAEVTELIQGYVVAMNLETTEEELMHTVFPHPTLSEMMKEAVLDAYGRVVNI